MSSESSRLVDVGHGGIGWTMTEWQTIRDVFHNFPHLPSNRNDLVQSSKMKCHGFEWKVRLYPDRSACLANWGKFDFIRRDDVLDPSNNILVNGSLIIEMDIQILLETPPTWAPSDTLGADMLKMLELADPETADILFEVSKNRRRKKKFYAHRNVLTCRAPALAALLEDCNNNTPFPIQDMDGKVFWQLLCFVYNGEVPADIQVPDDAQTLITVADQFGITGLKIAAECKLASCGITIDNVAELILFADAKNCAELKEAAVEFFMLNAEAVMATDGFTKVQESAEITKEHMLALACGNKKRPAPSDNGDSNYSSMRVRVLRRKLDEKGLELDGSKEVLIARLKEAEEVEAGSD